MEPRVYSVIRYDGRNFEGWQRQRKGRTVQAEIESALRRLFDHQTAVVAAGRTDSGVHALGQVIHFRPPSGRTAPELHRALRSELPRDIWIEQLGFADPQFHARKLASSRTYLYLVGTDEGARSPFRSGFEWHINPRPRLSLLRHAASLILGEHDFRGLSAVGQKKPHYRCRIARSEWHERPLAQGFTFTIEADRFLHRMVRFLVGTMVEIGLGRRPVEDLSSLLHSENNSGASPPAPAHGLYFVGASYPQLTRIFDYEVFPRHGRSQ